MGALAARELQRKCCARSGVLDQQEFAVCYADLSKISLVDASSLVSCVTNT